MIPASAKIGDSVVIEDGVILGENVTIGHHCVLLAGTKLGDNVTVGHHCVLGVRPGGNATMRTTGVSNLTLTIGSGTRIGQLVSLYTGTVIGENSFVADHASIRENVVIGPGTVIGRAAIVELNTTIGASCTIQTNAYVTGDTTIEDHVFIGPCVSMSNDKYMGAQPYSLAGPTIRSGAKIGNNATLLPGVVIGKLAIVGAGSVVTRDVPDQTVVVGVPAALLDPS
ncbi:N-acetyltransferase [Tumebacillus sp. ITR2]|uniref:N-acetyltransferase n=1 Tax=Tumebacillus amylolyticus TaxID=2801339 RepID=A0ABS1JCM1_9BACL|nr:acyltransferase [Tumebacillus amylolyticus]MBL0388011.1 N-acetyltransferase [Tumebacillus amylolyticus]